jgi:hypothetical protein
VRPAEHIRLKIQTHLASGHSGNTGVGVCGITRARREYEHSQELKKNKAKTESATNVAEVSVDDSDPFGATDAGRGFSMLIGAPSDRPIIGEATALSETMLYAPSNRASSGQ